MSQEWEHLRGESDLYSSPLPWQRKERSHCCCSSFLWLVSAWIQVVGTVVRKWNATSFRLESMSSNSGDMPPYVCLANEVLSSRDPFGESRIKLRTSTTFCKIFTCTLSWTHAKTCVLEDSELGIGKETATQKSHCGNSGPIYQNGNNKFQPFEVVPPPPPPPVVDSKWGSFVVNSNSHI